MSRSQLVNSQIHISKFYTQLFVFCYEIMNSGDSRLNPDGVRLKDRNQGIFMEFSKYESGDDQSKDVHGIYMN